MLSSPGLREALLGLYPAFGRSSQAPGETTPHDGTCWGHQGEEGLGHPLFLVPYQPPHWGPRDHDCAATRAAPPYDMALELYEKLPLDPGCRRLVRKRGNRQALPGAALPAQARTFQAPEPAMGSTEPISASRGEVTAGAPQSRTPVGPPAGCPSHCAAPAALDLAAGRSGFKHQGQSGRSTAGSSLLPHQRIPTSLWGGPHPAAAPGLFSPQPCLQAGPGARFRLPEERAQVQGGQWAWPGPHTILRLRTECAQPSLGLGSDAGAPLPGAGGGESHWAHEAGEGARAALRRGWGWRGPQSGPHKSLPVAWLRSQGSCTGVDGGRGAQEPRVRSDLPSFGKMYLGSHYF